MQSILKAKGFHRNSYFMISDNEQCQFTHHRKNICAFVIELLVKTNKQEVS